MEVTGKVKVITEVESVSDKFKKRDIVVTTEEQYPQDISIQFVQDKTDLLNNYKAGQNVRVSINLRGREWTSPQGEFKYFNTIQGWRIETLTEVSGVPAASFKPATDLKEAEHEDLPF